MAKLEARNLAKKYGAAAVFSNISFEISAGSSLCLFGPSGCGKTTLLRTLAGLELPDQGVVFIDGKPCNSARLLIPPHERNLGMVFQDLALWPHMRTARHLDFVLQSRKLTRSQRRERVEELLHLVDLDGKARAFPAQLSGGEQQRLAMARALALAPDLILLDEPFSHLDAARRDGLINVLNERRAGGGMKIVFATHDADEVRALADSVLDMRPDSSTCTVNDWQP